MPSELSDFYARNRRRAELADAEWAARAPFPGLQLAPAAADWAARFGDEPLTGASDIWRRLDRVLARAVDDRVLLLPEPGTVTAAYAHRDPETERETHAGFGFAPAAAEALIIHSGSAVPLAALGTVAQLLPQVVAAFAGAHAFTRIQ